MMHLHSVALLKNPSRIKVGSSVALVTSNNLNNVERLLRISIQAKLPVLVWLDLVWISSEHLLSSDTCSWAHGKWQEIVNEILGIVGHPTRRIEFTWILKDSFVMHQSISWHADSCLFYLISIGIFYPVRGQKFAPLSLLCDRSTLTRFSSYNNK